MKKLTLSLCLLIGTFSVMSFTEINENLPETEISRTSNFCEGFADGFCEGYKDEKGQYVICPITPICPIPKIGQSNESYRDGYNTGFRAGMRAARD